MASNFPVENLGQLEQLIILAVTSCWARRFSGGLQLSATPATYYYMNPDVEEARHIRETYGEMVVPMPPLQLPAPNAPNQQPGQPRNLTPLNVVMQTNPDSLVQQFTVRAVIQAIDEQMAWYFNRCRTCGNKVTEYMPHRHCQLPGVRQTPNYSYCFRITLADDTGNIILTCFSPEANSLITTSVTELITYIPDPDPYVFPPLILALQNTTHIFHIHLAKGSRRGMPCFILDAAENVDLPALPQPPPQIQEPDIPVTQETQPEIAVVPDIGKGTSVGDTSASPVAAESPVQTSIATEIGMSTITSPPMTDEPAETTRTEHVA